MKPEPLIFIRHSIPEIVPELPANQWRLSPEGRQRCLPLADNLASRQPELIFSSFEPKAVETAQIVAEQLGLPTAPYSGLHEHERRSVSYTTKSEFEAAVARLFAQPDELVFGEETANQVLGRFSQAVETLRAQHPDKRLAIVSHGTVISLFVDQTCQIEAFDFWKRLGMPALVAISPPEPELGSKLADFKLHNLTQYETRNT
jgi:broad specificity phosphatase PhoE